VIPEEGPAYLLNNVKNFNAEKLTYEVRESAKAAQITGNGTAEVHLAGLPEELVDIASEVNNAQVIIR